MQPHDATHKNHTYSQSDRTLASTSELEGIQALLHKPHSCESALQPAKGRPHTPCIASKGSNSRYPFTGQNSGQPDAPVILTGRWTSASGRAMCATCHWLQTSIARFQQSSHDRMLDLNAPDAGRLRLVRLTYDDAEAGV